MNITNKNISWKRIMDEQIKILSELSQKLDKVNIEKLVLIIKKLNERVGYLEDNVSYAQTPERKELTEEEKAIVDKL